MNITRMKDVYKALIKITGMNDVYKAFLNIRVGTKH